MYFRKLILVFLIFLFLGLFFKSLSKIINRETGSKYYIDRPERNSFPSIVICPILYNFEEVRPIYYGSNFSYEDIENLPSVMNTVQGNMFASEPYGSK